ncbi:MAG: photosystem I reaction center subunit XII [Merismopedia sp. SIO2A8]|nr:photosystem I reaction center subunit XII [Symploca sp. SIO2B6]NET49609.1 photosystem I reaction center subunit XII [Merismopedia sp. SIO2A8]
MLGESVIVCNSSSPLESCTYVYEIKGLRQNEENDKNSYTLHKSDSIFIQIPHSRMNNEQMRRITHMGGKIVSVRLVKTKTE